MTTEAKIAVGLISTQHDVSFEILAQWAGIFHDQPGWGDFFPIRSTYVLQGRNQLAYEASGWPDWTNLLMWDVDQMPPRVEPDGTTLLERLQSIAHLDVVTGLYVTRAFPYPPVAMREKPGDLPRYLPYDEVAPLLQKRGLLEVDIVGTGSMLIRREVLEAVAELRGFPDAPLWDTESRTTGDDAETGRKRVWVIGEDIRFCRDARSLGFKVWLDSRWESGHYEERLVSSRDYQMAAQASLQQARMAQAEQLWQEAERRHAQGNKLWVPGMAKN